MVGGELIKVETKNSWKSETLPPNEYLLKYEFFPLMYELKLSLKEVYSFTKRERSLILKTLEEVNKT